MHAVSSMVVQAPLLALQTPLLHPTVMLEQFLGVPPEQLPAEHCWLSLQRSSLQALPLGWLLGAQVPAPSQASGWSQELDEGSPQELPAGSGAATQMPAVQTPELQASSRKTQSAGAMQSTLPPVPAWVVLPGALVLPPVLIVVPSPSSSSELLFRSPSAQAAKPATASRAAIHGAAVLALMGRLTRLSRTFPPEVLEPEHRSARRGAPRAP
jgi:hypothetical protein